MSGQIFISYRREDASSAAGRLYDRLSARFSQNQIFFDIDNIDLGIDFVKAIEESVASCDVLIAVIGRHWLVTSDETGRRRLDNPEDFVRVEIGTALKRDIRVIPVLVEGASMPRSGELPDDLKPLARRNALNVSHDRFRVDADRLVGAVERALEKNTAEKREREEEGRMKTRNVEAYVRTKQPISAVKNKIFISYSHEDEDWKKALEKFLKPYVRSASVTAWSDKQIAPGSKWFDEIKGALAESSIVLMLVTPNFLASDFINEHELGPALEQAETGGLKILWVPVRFSAYTETALQKYQAVIPPDKPLAEMKGSERDKAWLRICEEIKKVTA